MIYLPTKELCFICPPKNGTHTLYHNLTLIGGQRIGEYHEYRSEYIPVGSKIAMVWRDPVERAVSLYRDIVIREQEGKRKVKQADSIALIENIVARSPTFDAFIELLIDESHHPSPYLLKPQSWWLARFEPGAVFRLSKLDEMLFEITGRQPEKKHTCSDHLATVSVSSLQEKRFRGEWDLSRIE